MINFSDLGIKPKENFFTGDKIKLERVINTEVIIKAYKIEDSIKKPGTKYLTLQIIRNREENVIFTGSNNLIYMIEQVPEDKFPFKTTIIKENQQYQFT